MSEKEEKPILSETKTSALFVKRRLKPVDRRKLAAGWRDLAVLKEFLAVLEQIAEAS